MWTLTLLFFLTSCRWCVSGSCVIVGLHACTHSQGDLGDRPLPKREEGVSAHQQRLCVPGWSGRVPWKHQSSTSFGWKFLLPKLLTQTRPKKVEPRRLIRGWGDWQNPAFFGAAFWFIPSVIWVCGSGCTGCDFSQGKPAAYLCLFVFQCCTLPSSPVSLFY